MGYADTIPFVSLTSQVAGTYTTYLPFTTVSFDNTDFFRFTTLNYKKPINYAYATLIVPCRTNTNVLSNYIDNNTYLQITDSVTLTDTNCGTIPLYSCFTTGSTTAHSEYRIPLSTNIASALTPNRLYYCALMDSVAAQNNLNLIMPYVEVRMYGNI